MVRGLSRFSHTTWVFLAVAASVLSLGVLLLWPHAPVAAETAASQASGSVAPEWLSTTAATIATSNEDPTPSSVRFVLTTVGAARAMLGGDIPIGEEQRECYIIVLAGKFVAVKAFTPPGVPHPEGNCIVCAVDPKTHEVMGFTLWPESLEAPTSTLPGLAPLPGVTP